MMRPKIIPRRANKIGAQRCWLLQKSFALQEATADNRWQHSRL
jgi:hypothetical protein